MKTDGQAFLEQIAVASTNKFEIRFSKISTRLDLGAALDATDLSSLYEAAFLATLCNISFNGLAGCSGKILPERELARCLLEREFMAARDKFYRCDAIDRLSVDQHEAIERIFLSVMVDDENLA